MVIPTQVFDLGLPTKTADLKINFTYFAIDLGPHIRQQIEAEDALT
jgi:hypothetical protein